MAGDRPGGGSAFNKPRIVVAIGLSVLLGILLVVDAVNHDYDMSEVTLTLLLGAILALLAVEATDFFRGRPLVTSAMGTSVSRRELEAMVERDEPEMILGGCRVLMSPKVLLRLCEFMEQKGDRIGMVRMGSDYEVRFYRQDAP